MTPNDIPAYMAHVGVAARAAATAMAAASTAAKDRALRELAQGLRGAVVALQAANALDLAAAQAAGLAAPLLDRLKLTPKIIDTVAEGCEQIAAMADPVGEITGLRRRPSGISVGQMRVPLGVFGMIYESRPNVTIEAASLAIKSGNACILRGGSEALQSNLALWRLVQAALVAAGLPADAVQLVQTTDRAAVGRLITMPEYVDVVIPRGGKSLIERISAEAKVPVIKHLDGNCHVYVDGEVELDLALRVADNAKTQKYSPCNAAESLLVHEAQAAAFLPRIGAVFAAKGVEMRCDERAAALLSGLPKVLPATEADWAEEYLAPIVSIRVVASLDEAIAHINRYGSHHTDAILTTNHPHAMRFLREVDSASVMVNASTRFADGFEYGLGAEIGISTDKFHARGPVGLEGLTSLKWVVLGQGEIPVLMPLSKAQIAVLFAAAILVFWMVGAHNRVVALRTAIGQAWQLVDEVITRRGEAVLALVAAIREALAAEQGALDALVAAQAHVRAAADALRSGPTQAARAAALVAAESAMASASARVLALLEQSPELRADAAVAPHVTVIHEAVARLVFSRQLFNEAAAAYDAAVQQFPTRLLSGLYGFGTAGRL